MAKAKLAEQLEEIEGVNIDFKSLSDETSTTPAKMKIVESECDNHALYLQ